MNSKKGENNDISKDLPSPAARVASVKYSPRMTTSARNVERRENGQPRTYKGLTRCAGCDKLEAIAEDDYLCGKCRNMGC